MLPSLSSEDIPLESPRAIVRQNKRDGINLNTVSSFSIEWNSNKHIESLSLPLVSCNEESGILLKKEDFFKEIFTDKFEETKTVTQDLMNDSDVLKRIDLILTDDQDINSLSE